MTDLGSTDHTVDAIDRTVDAVVIGGGITGLSAAYFIRKQDPRARVVVLEASDRPGGKIASAHIAGTTVDCGPDAFLARVEGAVELADDLGLGDRMIAPGTGKAWLWTRGKLRPFPDGLVLGAPTDTLAVARSGILSLKGLLRVAISEIVPTTLQTADDPTVAEAISRHVGREVVDQLVDPLLGGINASDCDRLSLASAAPNLVAAVNSRYLMRTLRRSQAAAARGAIGVEADPAARPVFLTPRTGINTMTARLAEELAEAVVCSVRATGIHRTDDGSWVVGTDGGPGGPGGPDGDWTARQVVLAAPAAAVATLVAGASPSASSLLREIRTSSVALTLLAYPAAAVHLPPGSGMLVPRKEGKLLTASSWWNQKWPHLDTNGFILLRASAGRDGDTRFMDLSDEELVNRLHSELSEILDITARPLETHVARWINGFPQYDSGHAKRVDAIEAALTAEAPGLLLAGASYRGIGIPACIRSAKAAARRAADAISSART
jgi:protoporphyrinogen/coproporphyrinogen III oxidase